MKKLVFLAFLSISGSVFGEEAKTVEINSFSRISDNQKNMTAEICGQAIGQKKRVIIDIISDPKSKRPTPFTTISQPDGSFCHLITTYMGQAIAKVGEGPKTEANIY